ncbi:glycine cleavage system aminomethyltransferase GcvT [Rhodohalobacter sp. 614A]|uniref:glycine cleavage system aminomethyltransferase GcvT n=1 Tax=Rhodohalobacter sp. 614A TaxID=2908649 RepID=UPI001F0109E8|nr:glycine cleavage system aminomethyltransferase GcvT [Rhodohalobacter sp. 614A]
MLKKTPLYTEHKELGARLIDFGGFEMPVQYAGIKQEHLAVRKHAGLFDVSHMGEFFISGPEALALIQKVTINDASVLTPGRAQYSAMCYENGGIIDDLLVYMLDEEQYMLVVNASNIEKDLDWIQSKNSMKADVQNRSDSIGLLALQGPKSVEILQKLTSTKVASIPFYRFEKGSVAGEDDIIISATGYTGEKGFELYMNTDQVDIKKIWVEILQAGKEFNLEPAGLGARDTLRLEMGYPLYGNDITRETNPLEARMGWLTKLQKEDFVGKESLLEQKSNGIPRKLMGFEVQEERKIPRSGYEIRDSYGSKIGFVTSGTHSISLNKGIGLGYMETSKAAEGEKIFIKIRKDQVPAMVIKPPFINK